MSLKVQQLIFILLLMNHHLYCQCTDCGSFTFRIMGFDSTSNDFKPVSHERDVRILYKDSTAIIPRTIVYTSYVNGKEKEWHSEDMFYTYVDLHAKPYLNNRTFSKDSIYSVKCPGVTFYEYPSFSKDSLFSIKYYNLDTAWARVGSYFFLGVKPIKLVPDTTKALSPANKKRMILADTTIEGIVYKRQRVEAMAKKANQEDVSYLSIQIDYCQMTGIEDWMFIFKPKDEKWGGIFSRIDWAIIGIQPWYSQQYVFKSGLTKEELEVFAAWEKNAKENPVTGTEKY